MAAEREQTTAGDLGPPVDVARLSYRELRGREEMDGIARLFDIAGWGPVPADRLADWFLKDTEFGRTLMMVIADDANGGEILGMTMYSPYPVWIGDRVEIAARGRAQVLDPRIRRRARGVAAVDESDPSYKLGLVGWQLLEERGWRLLFGLPNPSLIKREEKRTVEQVGHRDWHVYGPGLRVELADVPPLPCPLEVTIGSAFGDEYDRLWDSARANLGIDYALLRSAAGLRFSRGNQLRLELRRPGSSELVGYSCLHNMRDGKLNDVLAVDVGAMGDVVLATVSWLRANPEAHHLQWMNTVPHPTYRDAVIAATGEETEWIFSFNLMTRSETVGPEFDAAAWYVTTGD